LEAFEDDTSSSASVEPDPEYRTRKANRREPGAIERGVTWSARSRQIKSEMTESMNVRELLLFLEEQRKETDQRKEIEEKERWDRQERDERARREHEKEMLMLQLETMERSNSKKADADRAEARERER